MILPQMLSHMANKDQLYSETTLHRSFFPAWLAHLTFWTEYWPLSLASAVVAAFGILCSLKGQSRMTVLFLVPPIVVLAIVYLLKSWIYPRYFMLFLPMFFIAMVKGIRVLAETVFPRRWANWGTVLGAMLLVGAPSAFITAKYYHVGKQNYREAARMATQLAGPNATIVSYGFGRDWFRYYEPRAMPIKNASELSQLISHSQKPVYLLYSFDHVLRNKQADYWLVYDNFVLVRRFPGMLKDDWPDIGDVYLLKNR
jgi:4-amino-4-deoxy-L-arabinose transferase-like glycosyltransferase